MSLFSNLKNLFSSPFDHETATGLYVTVVRQARQPEFYLKYQVADTVAGRFDMVALHACLVLRRLRSEQDNEQAKNLSQAVFDLMFADMDQNLRELSIGDTGVAKRIKKMVEGFYGRMAAYDLALNMSDEPRQVEELKNTIIRNIYRDTLMDDSSVNAMADYIRSQSAHLETQKLDALLDGKITFAALSEE